MNIKKVTAALTAAALFFMNAAYAAPATDSKTDDESPQIEYSGGYLSFEQIAEGIAERYIDDRYTKEDIMSMGLSKLLDGDEELLIELLKATLSSMDDYSEYFTSDEYRDFLDNMNNTFYGIGIKMRENEETGYVEITDYAEDSDNAEKAGLKIGDIIYKVNGEDMTGHGLSAVRTKIVGEEGTTVEITVLRDGEELTFNVKRVAVSTTTVTGSILKDDVGYIKITSFNDTTADDFTYTLGTMREQNVKKIILDLRNNGGGVTAAAIDVAEQIVPKGKIIDVKFRDKSYDATYNSTLDKKEFDFAVLVNGNTASASEILASAIQDSKAGKLVGTNTFGKAVIQNIFPLKNGSVFKLTTGEYITRDGRQINGVGLEPDVYVDNIAEPVDVSQYTPFDFVTSCSLGSRHQNVKAVKERLALMGYYDGDTESDLFDVKLKDALKTVQQLLDIFSYGVLDTATQQMLDDVFSKLQISNDDQFDAAYKLLGGTIE